MFWSAYNMGLNAELAQFFTNNTDNLVFDGPMSTMSFPLLESFFGYVVRNQITIPQYRTLAKHGLWRLYWNIGKPNPFKCDSIASIQCS